MSAVRLDTNQSMSSFRFVSLLGACCPSDPSKILRGSARQNPQIRVRAAVGCCATPRTWRIGAKNNIIKYRSIKNNIIIVIIILYCPVFYCILLHYILHYITLSRMNLYIVYTSYSVNLIIHHIHKINYAGSANNK